MRDLVANLPAYLGGHMLLSVAALAAALAVSLPLGVAASRRPRLAEVSLAVAGVIQTVPGLALLALLMLLLNERTGFLPAFLALALYGVLPILANTVVGIRGVDPALTEAARGLGMSGRQTLWRVELPLAAPVLIGGVRTATVLVVGTATLATPVGGQSLGNYIFAGIATLNHASTAFGCVAAALLAVGLDQLVRLLEVAARRRSRRLACAAAAGLLLVVAGGLYEPVSRWLGGGNRAVVACASFTEQYTLSHALARRLEAAGFHTERREGMGYGMLHVALRRGDVDCMVAYTGDVWTMLMKRQDFSERESMRAEVVRFLEEEYGVVCVGRLGYENAYALAITRRRAEEWKVDSIADLARRGQPLRIAGDIGVFHRPEWQRLRERYPLGNAEPVTMDQSLTYGALAAGEVDAVLAYSSDGRIKLFGLQLLADPAEVFPPYDALLLVSRAAAARPGFVDAVRPLVGAIDPDTIQEANGRVDVGQQPPRRVAEWLLDKIESGTRR
ncbi:MAG: ABC transporter permease [Isosphaera sp.]|nr:ABC transporter permease [Isosphaera sp.]